MRRRRLVERRRRVRTPPQTDGRVLSATRRTPPFVRSFDGAFLRFVINILIRRFDDAFPSSALARFSFRNGEAAFGRRRGVSTVSTALKRLKRSFGAVVTLCLTILFVREFPAILQNFIKRLSATWENERFRKRKNPRPRPRPGQDGAPRSHVGRKTRKIGFSALTVKIATYPFPTAEKRSSSTRAGTDFTRFIDFNVNFHGSGLRRAAPEAGFVRRPTRRRCSPRRKARESFFSNRQLRQEGD